MLPDQIERSAPGLQHYDDMLALTGRQFRFTGGDLSVGVVLGMLDARTARLRCERIQRGLEALLADQLYPVFDRPHLGLSYPSFFLPHQRDH